MKDVQLKLGNTLRVFKQGWGNSLGAAWGVETKDLPLEVGQSMQIGGCSRGVKDGDLLISDYFGHRYLFEIKNVEYQGNPSDLWFGECVLIEIDDFTNEEVKNLSNQVDKYILCHY